MELLAYVQDPAIEKADLANVTIVYNRLSSIGNVYEPAFGFGGFNLANIHFHGAGFPPSLEDLHNPLDGGESRTFEYMIPEDQPPGLAWYHSHVHGNSEYDYLSGLFGAMVIEDTANDVTAIPEIGNATEIIMILSEALVDAETGIPPPFFPIAMAFSGHSVVNGLLADDTVYEFTQGETVLFRSISASVEPTLRLYFNETGAPDFLVVAEDGFPVASFNGTGTDKVIIAPGSRVEFMVKFDTPGTYTLRREGWTAMGIRGVEACNASFGIPAPNCISSDVDMPIATVIVLPADSPVEASLPTRVPEYHQVYKDMEAREVTNSRTITLQLQMGFPLFQIPYEGDFVPPGFAFGINDRLLTPHYTHGDIVDGTCEQWTVVGDPPGLEHSFHIHTNPFLVYEEDGVPVPAPFWRDSYTFMGNNMTIKTCFNRLSPGDLVLVHCHSVTHLDVGMGAFFRVVNGNANTTTGSTSATDGSPETPPGDTAVEDGATPTHAPLVDVDVNKDATDTGATKSRGSSLSSGSSMVAAAVLAMVVLMDSM